MRSRKIFSPKLIISVIILILLVVGGAAAMVLSQLSQDVRQQASGCTYWDGSAAPEGSYDNRGGIRQQCASGYWSKPDDGITDPRGMFPEKERPQRGCVMWDGTEVSAGAYDNRGGIRQQCNDGLWSHPDDGITDPNDVSSLALVGTLSGLEKGEVEYADARKTYDQYCRANVHSTDVDRCKSLGNQLTKLEADIRWSALNDRVLSNTEAVSSALGGLDDRSMDFNQARQVYREFCQGAKAQQTSSSACQSLKSELDEIEALRTAAETAKWTALTETVQGNTEKVSRAIGGLDERTVDFNEARSVYREYCQGAKGQQTSVSACNSLKSELDEIEALRTAAETARYTALTDTVQANTREVTTALGGLEDRSLDINQANSIYRQYCQGAKAQQTSSSACNALSDSITEIETLRNQAVQRNAEVLTEVVTTNTNNVNYAVSAINAGVMDIEAAQDTYDQHCVGAGAQQTSRTACASLKTAIAESKQPQVVATVEVSNNRPPTSRLDPGEITEIEAIVDSNDQGTDGSMGQQTRSSSRGFFGNIFSGVNQAWSGINTFIAQSEVNLAINSSDESLDAYRRAQDVYARRCGSGTSNLANTQACNNLQTALIENQPIEVSSQVAERYQAPRFNFNIRGFFSGSYYSDVWQSSLSAVRPVPLLSSGQYNIDLSQISFLTDPEFDGSTIFACDLEENCQVMRNGRIENVTLSEIESNLGAYGLTKAQQDELYRNGYIITHWTDGVVRGTRDEVNPFEIRVCVRECEWIVANEQNVRGLAYTVLTDGNNYRNIISDMDGDGYVLQNDLDIFLANSSIDRLLELVVKNDSNWSQAQVDNLMDNYDGEFYLAMPNVDDLNDLNSIFANYSVRQNMIRTYGFSDDVFPAGLTYPELNQANTNVQNYFVLETLSNSLAGMPIFGQSMSHFLKNASSAIVSCEGQSLDPDVCNMQRTIIQGVNSRNSVANLEKETGLTINYTGEMDYGTMRYLSTAFDILPPEYYGNAVNNIFIHDTDAGSSGFTHQSGSFQADPCPHCYTNDGLFWHYVGTVVHETAHNREEVAIPAGNYCLDSGSCIKVDEQTTGVNLMQSVLENHGLTFSPNGIGIIYGFSSGYKPHFHEDELTVAYDTESYAFTNLAEFYAETLSDAILYPEDFATANPELYTAAVVINGFETESYIDEFGNRAVRRKGS